jgi:tRNA pseudouridine38-40 synthase
VNNEVARPSIAAGPVNSVLLTVAYDGGTFSGWAPQDNARTVAGELLGAIRALDPTVASVRGASRTDRGVHARGQLAWFTPSQVIPPRGWVLGLNAHLPAEIAVRGAARIAQGGDLRGQTIRKRYRYLILRDELRDPFWERCAARFPHRLDLEVLSAEASSLLGTHDFAAFRSSMDTRTDTVRTIESVHVETLPRDPRILIIDVVGNAFMHNMVRIIVGSLLDVARGHLPRGTLAKALLGGTRADLGMTAPAHGLCLETIEHSLALEDVWP